MRCEGRGVIRGSVTTVSGPMTTFFFNSEGCDLFFCGVNREGM